MKVKMNLQNLQLVNQVLKVKKKMKVKMKVLDQFQKKKVLMKKKLKDLEI